MEEARGKKSEVLGFVRAAASERAEEKREQTGCRAVRRPVMSAASPVTAGGPVNPNCVLPRSEGLTDLGRDDVAHAKEQERGEPQAGAKARLCGDQVDSSDRGGGEQGNARGPAPTPLRRVNVGQAACRLLLELGALLLAGQARGVCAQERGARNRAPYRCIPTATRLPGL